MIVPSSKRRAWSDLHHMLRMWPVFAAAGCGIALTLLAWQWLDTAHKADGQRNFDAETIRVARRVNSRMDVYAALLTAGTALIGTSKEVSRADWQELVASLDLAHNYPGALSYAYAARVPAADRAAFENSMRAGFDPAFRIFPDPVGGDSYPALFAGPDNDQRRRIIGFDLSSEAMRRDAMLQAVHSNLPVLSGPIVLRSAAEKDTNATVILFAPVFRRGQAIDTPDQRTAALRGFVYAVFRIDELVYGMFSERQPQLAFDLFDENADGAHKPIYSCCRKVAPVPGDLSATRFVQAGWRIWALKFSAPAKFGVTDDRIQQAVLLSSGGLMTLLATLVMWMMLRTRLRAETLARRMTLDLEKSRTRFERMVAGTSDGVWEFDAATRVCFLSPRFLELLGYPASEVDRQAEWVISQVHKEDILAAGQAFEAMLRESGRYDRKLRMQTLDGSFRWFRVRGRVFESQGKLTVAGSMSDIQAEHEAAQREARLMSVNELSPDLVMTIDPNGDITYMNGAAQKHFGVAGATGKPGKLGVSAIGIVPGAEIATRMPRIAPASTRDLWQGETDLITASGQVLPMSQVIVGHRDSSGHMVYYSTVMRDISERRNAMLALQQAQERLERAFDISNDGLWERTIETDAFYSSPRCRAMLGYTGNDPAFNATAVAGLVHPDDRQTWREAIERIFHSDRAVTWDCRMQCASGAYRWIRTRGVLFRNAAGKPALTAGTMSDIHESRLAELELKRHRDDLAGLVVERTRGLELARKEAEQARKAAEDANLAKSEFLANMSHELRTPMHAIISFANFGVDKIGRVDEAKLAGYFRNIQTSGTRLLSLLNDLLDLAKLEAGKMEIQRTRTLLADLLKEALTEAGALAQSRDLRLNLSIADGDEGMRADLDASRVLQVVRNLLSNAIKFSPAGSVIEVAAAPVRMRATDGEVAGVEISVRDAGVGIPDAELASVFDKFVQSSKTKTGAGGTGLGLAICREIVAAHGGTIHASSNAPAPGATLTVRFPRDAAMAAAATEPVMGGHLISEKTPLPA
jgi:PAS domain S-box-containing protein